MIDRNSPVSEDEFHAFIDGELPVDRREAVAMHLADHPEQAALVASWRAQTEAIRARYGATIDEPVPARFNLDRLMRDSAPSRGFVRKMAAAAAIAAFIGGGAAGWFARGASASVAAQPAVAANGATALTVDALDAHQLYVVEVRHPVEVPGSERAHMTAWLSKRLGYEQRIPDLQTIGLKLVGGRLLPGPTGAAAFYMYEGASGERFTFYCAKALAKQQQSAMRFQTGKEFAAVSWVDNNVGYVISGAADRERLETVSKAIFEQVDPGAGKKS